MTERDRRHASGDRDGADRDYDTEHAQLLPPFDVGKRTRTHRMPHRSREDVFAAALARLKAWLPRLARAVAANDFDEAATTALVIRRALEDARETARADERSVLEPLVREAAGLLAQAPELSDVALRERYRVSDKRPSWDAE